MLHHIVDDDDLFSSPKEDPLFSTQPPPIVHTKTVIPNPEPVAIVEPVTTVKPSSVSKLQV